MNEDYVTFEQAKRLKKFGFNWKCDHWYTSDKELCYSGRYEFDPIVVMAPTLAQVVKWLYEISGYFISVQYNEKHEKFQCVIYKQSFTQGYYSTNETWPVLYLPDHANMFSNEPIICLRRGINTVLEHLKKRKK